MNFLKGRQGAGAGSAFVAFSFLVSGALTYLFQGLSARFLGEAGYGDLILLWTSTFLVVQTLWIGTTQTLGRYVSERLSRGESPDPVIASVRRLQILTLVAFVVLFALAAPVISPVLFDGDWFLTLAFAVAVVAYAPEYFRRGTFNGRRQAARLGALHVVESACRALLAAIFLISGAGVLGPALAIILAPVAAVILIRPTREAPAGRGGESFSVSSAFVFTAPVILCVAFGQTLMNGGPILLSLLGASRAEVGVFGAALILTRVPQYVMSPVIGALLPHASRALATEGAHAFDRFVARAAAIMFLIGASMVGGAWLLGERAMRLFVGFEANRDILTALALLAAFYLLSETLNQALFALGRARLAALGWLAGLPVTALCLSLPIEDPAGRVALALALGAAAATLAQAAFYLSARTGAAHSGGESR